MHLWQEGAHKKTKINVDGMTTPKGSPEMLKLIWCKYYGIALAMKRTGYSATLQKLEICVCKSCASLTGTRNPKIDVLQLAGRRPAIK